MQEKRRPRFIEEAGSCPTRFSGVIAGRPNLALGVGVISVFAQKPDPVAEFPLTTAT